MINVDLKNECPIAYNEQGFVSVQEFEKLMFSL